MSPRVLTSSDPVPPAQAASWEEHLRVQADLLDGLEIAMCAFDHDDRAVCWNRSFLRLFPEHDGFVHRGENYSQNLRRFYRLRLDAADLPQIEKFVEAGVARHRSQMRPFEFSHRGLRLQVASEDVPGHGRMRIWRTLNQLVDAPSPAPDLHIAQGWELLDQVPEALVVCAPDGLIIWTNAAFRAAVGIEASRIAGRTVEGVYEQVWRSSGEGTSKLAAGLSVLRENLRMTGAPFDLPLPQDRHFRVTARLSRNGSIFYSCSDVTALKRYEGALELTLDNAGRGIIRTDPQGRIVLHNRRALTLLDLPEPLLTTCPTISEVIRFQQARGDFGRDDEFRARTPDAARMLAAEAQGIALPGAGGKSTYLRRTRAGMVLEVATLPLPDGGAVRTFSDVTAYVETQEALSAQQHALSLTLESMAQGISAFDSAGRIVFWNKRYQQLLDLPDDVLRVGVGLDDLVRYQIQRGDFGDDFSLVESRAQSYVAAADQIRPLQGPDTYLRKTHDGRTLEVHTRPLPDGGAVRTFTDRTAFELTREALTKERALLGALVSNLPDRVWVKDLEGKYRLSNRAHQQFHGFADSDVVARTACELFGPEEGARQQATDLQALASVEPVRFEARMRTREGALRDMEIVKVAMHDGRRRIGLLGIARDITARKQAEAELIAAREGAIEASMAKTRFLSSMSHEIRTPMNAILGMLTLLRGTQLSERQDDYAAKADGAARSLLSLLNDVLDYSKIEAGKMQLDLQPFSLDALLADLSVIFSATVGGRDVEFLYDLDPRIPGTLVGDDMRLRQILINLGGNAIKFTDRGHVVLRTRLHSSSAGRAQVAFEVRDTGIGIGEEDQRRLFSDFTQASPETARKFGGTGLGLGICRRLTELMGSRLELRSTLGQGSSFSFVLDLPVGEAPEAAAAPAGPSPRVLVVDGNALAADLLQRSGRSLGWDVDLACTAAEAIDRVQRSEPFDVILMDWRTPGAGDGHARERICSRHQGRQVPVVAIVSAHDRVPLEEAAPGPGSLVQAVLVKPVTPGMLQDAIQRVLGGPVQRLPEAAPQPLAGLRLLVAEDNPVNQQIARELLVGQGAVVDIACDGVEAVELLDSGKPFDAVLMDMLMPRMDGLQAAREIRERPGLRALPIIAMTANAMDSDRLECLAAGMNDHVGKPVVLAHVVAAVLRHVREAALSPQPPRAAPGGGLQLLDRAGAIARLGVPGLFERMLPIFATNLQKFDADLRAASSGHTHEDVCALMHTIKGTASTMGAELLAHAAAEEETRLRQEPGDLDPSIGRVRRALVQTLQAATAGT